ncbi:hypothetical protein E2986_00923 [Frieseomelitta varia]|uniref:Uncharacterized protein n=1 Tax=Frieseomelitta varia TaxID=561572 RepID=A0A833S4L6_9HYME|nr:hypothetical protein E2986_00923 [Frieseomelitta varia]
MQNSRKTRRANHGHFGWLYQSLFFRSINKLIIIIIDNNLIQHKKLNWSNVLCQEKNVKPLPAVQAYLSEDCLRFCVDRVALKDWSPILKSIAENRSLSKINVYSRSCSKRVREKVNTEEKLEKLW